MATVPIPLPSDSKRSESMSRNSLAPPKIFHEFVRMSPQPKLKEEIIQVPLEKGRKGAKRSSKFRELKMKNTLKIKVSDQSNLNSSDIQSLQYSNKGLSNSSSAKNSQFGFKLNSKRPDEEEEEKSFFSKVGDEESKELRSYIRKVKEIETLCKHTHQQVILGANKIEEIEVFSAKPNIDRSQQVFNF